LEILNKVILLSITLLTLLGLIFPAQSPWQFVCFQLIAITVTVKVIYFLVEQKKTYISLILPLITNANSAAMISLYTLIASNDIVYNNKFLIHYLEYSFPVNLAFTIPPIIIYLSSKLVEPRPQNNGLLKSNQVLSSKHHLISLAVVSFFFLSFFSDVLFEIPFLGYISRVGKEAFLLFAFWLGFWNYRLKGVFYVGLALIMVTTVFSVLSGGRFYAFIQMGGLFLGYIVSQPPKRRRLLTKIVIVSLPIVFSVSGVLSYVRGQIGRGDINIVNVQRLSDFVDTFSTIITDVEFLENNRSLSLEGIRRNIKWPNLSVIALSPGQIPYRGFESFGTEISAIFQIAGVSAGFDVESVRNAREINIERGLNTGMANRYGYNVNRLNSVEWGLLADSWSRGGPLVYMLYLWMIITLFATIERKIVDAKIHTAEKALLIIVLIRILWFNTGSDPLYYILRSLLLSFSMAFALILAVRFLTIRKYQKYHHSGKLIDY